MEVDRSVYVVYKSGRYLVGIPYSMVMRWSTSPWDAYHAKNRRIARSLAEKVAGKVRRFDPILGEVSQ